MTSQTYQKLLEFAKEYDSGNYPTDGFEIEVHAFLQEMTDDAKEFLQEILPLLIESKWLPDTATTDDVLTLFRKHNSWVDLDRFDDYFEDSITKAQKLTPSSKLGEETQQELVKLLERTREQINEDLDFCGPFPITSELDHGNKPFRNLITDLYHAAYKRSILIREFQR